MSDEEDDWFERAIREMEGDSAESDDADESEETAEEPAEEGTDSGAEGQSDSAEESADAETGTGAGTESPGTDTDESDLFGGEGTSAGETGDTFEDADSGGFDEEGADTFGGGDEADAFGGGDEADAFGGGDEADAFGGGDEANAFGGEEDDPFGGGESDPFGGGGGFGDDEFGGGGGGEFGFGDFAGGDEGGGGAGPDFDEEEFESDIDRIDVGIEGLDEMILGGVPDRSLMVTIGSAGTGKTTFGLQFLHQALRNDEKGVYITLEESRDAILSTAEEKGWPFREYVEEDRLAIVALDPIEMANSLASIRSDISRLVRDFGADRLVLDSVSLLEMMYDHPAKRRSEVFDFARSLKRAGVTTMLTSEASEDNAYTSRYGIVEYLVDAVFILQYVRPSDFRETRLAVEIQKIRDANHSRETKPYEITNEGISVYRQANIF